MYYKYIFIYSTKLSFDGPDAEMPIQKLKAVEGPLLSGSQWRRCRDTFGFP